MNGIRYAKGQKHRVKSIGSKDRVAKIGIRYAKSQKIRVKNGRQVYI